MKRIRAALCALLLLFPLERISAETQRVFTLEEAVQTALEHNADLRAKRIDLNSARRADKAAWNNFLPSVSASAGVSNSHSIYSPVEIPDDKKSSWSWSGSAGVSISLSTAVPFKIKQTSLAYSMAQTSCQKLEKDIAQQVASSFYALTAALKNIELLKENMNLANDLMKQTAANYNNGLASELDLLRSQYSYQSIKPQISQAQAAYVSDAAAFMVLLGLDPDTKFSLKASSTIQQLSLPPAAELAAAHLENRFDVIQQRQAVSSAELSLLTAQNSAYSPTISLSENISTGGKIEKDAGKPAVNGNFSASIRIPLDGFIPNSQNNLQVKNAKDKVESANIALETVLKNARRDIAKKVADVNRIYESLELNTLNNKIAEKAYALSAEGYSNGLVSQTDLASQRQERLRARQNLMQAEIEYITSINALANALNISTGELVSKYGVKAITRIGAGK